MSLLDAPTPLPVAQRRAQAALRKPRAILTNLVKEWSEGVDHVWNPPDGTTPAQILAQLGTSGVELFTRSAQLRAFLEGQAAGCTNIPAAARIQAVNLNADGTVTLKS